MIVVITNYKLVSYLFYTKYISHVLTANELKDGNTLNLCNYSFSVVVFLWTSTLS